MPNSQRNKPSVELPIVVSVTSIIMTIIMAIFSFANATGKDEGQQNERIKALEQQSHFCGCDVRGAGR